MSAAKVYWNGEPAQGERGFVTVPEHVEGDPPEAWWKPIVGRTEPVVVVRYYDQTHLLWNRDGIGWNKVTRGRGSPRWSHSSLPNRALDTFTPIRHMEKVAEALFWDSGDDLDGWVVSIEDNDHALGDRGGFATLGAAIDWANKQATDRGLVLATGGLTLAMNRLVPIEATR